MSSTRPHPPKPVRARPSRRAVDASHSAPAAPARDAEHLESLDKGLRVLELFGSGETAGFAMIEVAERLDMPRAVARRVLLTLERLGYLRSDGRRYALAPRVLALGYTYLASLGFREVARPVLQALAESTGHTCSIGVLDGDEVVYVLRAEAKRLVRIDLAVGSRIPAWANSMGRLLLSGLDAKALDDYLERLQPVRMTRHTVTDKRKLKARILEAGREGWCAIADEVEEGIRGIAAPLHDAEGRLIAATNISLAFHDYSEAELKRKILPLLIEKTRSIEEILRSGMHPT